MDMKNLFLVSGLALTMAISACSSEGPETKTSTASPPSEQTGGGSEVQPLTQGPAQGSVVSGTVLETLPAGGYTYVHLDRGTEKSWVAMPASAVEIGEEVQLVVSMVMPDFQSKTLNRTFDELIFSSGFAQPREGAAPPVGMTEGKGSFADAVQSETTEPAAELLSGDMGITGSSKAVVPQAADIQIDKVEGENSYTVEELYTQSADLNGRTVTVKGKVMKVSQRIMGTNWVHLQDGTGDPAQSTHDLVVTTDMVPQKDEIIIVTGPLAADKDFGSGYRYAVIIENATVSR